MPLTAERVRPEEMPAAGRRPVSAGPQTPFALHHAGRWISLGQGREVAGPAPAADSTAADSVYAQELTGVCKCCLCFLPSLAGNHVEVLREARIWFVAGVVCAAWVLWALQTRAASLLVCACMLSLSDDTVTDHVGACSLDGILLSFTVTSTIKATRRCTNSTSSTRVWILKTRWETMQVVVLHHHQQQATYGPASVPDDAGKGSTCSKTTLHLAYLRHCCEGASMCDQNL